MKLALLVVPAAFALFVLLTPGASATTNQIGCATTGYTQTGGSSAWWWASTDPTTDATTCVAESGSVQHAGSSQNEGTCTSVRIQAGSTGTPAGGAPTAIHLYVYADHDATTHTNTFTGYLSDINVGTTLPANVIVCRTMDATTSGATAPGNYRLVLRVCNYIGGSGCAGGTRAYDLWSDGGGNLPTGGSAYANERSGIITSRAFMLCSVTSANAAFGPTVTTFVPGDTPTLAVCTHAFNTVGYTLTGDAWNGGAGFANDITLQGGAWSGGSFVGTTPKITATEPDGSCTCQWANGATYTLNFTWTDGGVLGCYHCIPEGIVGWANTTTGTLNAGLAVHGAPFGSVNKALTATCVLRDPTTGSSTLAPAALHRGEQVQCRGIGLGGKAQVKNARGEDWASGAFVSVFARRESMPAQDTTDAPRCDVTTNAAGVYQCDVTLRASTYTNNAVAGGATTTTGLGYGVDVAIYQDSARTTLLARGHIAALFDTTSTISYASSTGACAAAPAATLPIAQRGQTEALWFKLCNARSELVTPAGTADVTREDTYIVDQGPQGLTPTSGAYSWSFVANGASTHTPGGYAKRLNFTDGNGNNATADNAYNVTDFLGVGAFHTWLKSCTGPESTLFVAAADTICANEGPVASATGLPWMAAKTFVRWYNDTPDNAALPSDTETGVTATTSSNHQLTPQPPAGTWTFTVRAYDANGNYGEASTTITIVSPLTSIYDILCSGTNVRVQPGETVTVVCTTMKRDPATSILQPFCPDALPYYRVNYTTSDGAWHTAAPTSIPTADAASACSYWINWTVPASWPDGQAAELLVNANMTGAPIHAYYPLNIETTKGADPALATADYSWDTHKATISISLKLGNGTARSGVAGQLAGQLYSPDDTTATTQLSFTERATTGTYYSRVDLGTSPTRGTWLAVITAPQPTGNATTSSAATFTVTENYSLDFLDARALTLAFWNSANATASYGFNVTNQSSSTTWALLNASWASANASNAYSWALENQTRAQVAGVQATQNQTSSSLATLALNLTIARAEANASAAYGWALQNQTSAAEQAAIAYATSLEEQALAQLAQLRADLDAQAAETNALVNATANATNARLASASSTLGITLTGDGGGALSYAGRANRLSMSIIEAGPGIFAAWFWTWDLGDNTTGIGPTIYHTWQDRGNYSVVARATDALGHDTLLTTNVSVITSTPNATILGPNATTQGAIITWTTATPVDAHDDIASASWEVDPTDFDVWLVGTQHTNKGSCVNCTTYSTRFVVTGDHTVTLHVTNAHGVTNETVLSLRVAPAPAPQIAPAGGAASQVGGANSYAQGLMSGVNHFLHWLTGA